MLAESLDLISLERIYGEIGQNVKSITLQAKGYSKNIQSDCIHGNTKAHIKKIFLIKK